MSQDFTQKNQDPSVIPENCEQVPSIINYLEGERNVSKFSSRISEILYTYSSKLYDEEIKTLTKIQSEKQILVSEENMRILVSEEYNSILKKIQQKNELKQSLNIKNQYQGYEIVKKCLKIPINMQDFAIQYEFKILKQEKNEIYLTKQKDGILGKLINQCLNLDKIIIFSIKTNDLKNICAIKMLQGKTEYYDICKNNLLKFIESKERNVSKDNLIYFNQQCHYQHLYQHYFKENCQICHHNELIHCLSFFVKIQKEIYQNLLENNYQCSQRSTQFIIQQFLLKQLNIFQKYNSFYEQKQRAYGANRMIFRTKYSLKQLIEFLQFENHTAMPCQTISQSPYQKLITQIQIFSKSNTIIEQIYSLKEYFRQLLVVIKQSINFTKSNLLSINILALIYSEMNDFVWKIKIIEHYFIIKQQFSDYFGTLYMAVQFITNYKDHTDEKQN